MKAGIVTYNIAKDWDLATIIKNCTDTRFDGVELRTGHAHGVELSLSPAQRSEVKRRFADSPVRIVQLGSTYEFHSVDPAEVRRNIEGCKQYIQLAHDVGAPGVKVRPNGLQTKAGIPAEKTLEQIGRSLREVGAAASDAGVEIRVEVHGSGTSRLDYMQRIMEVADHPMVTVNWNSNQVDLEGGTLEENFARVSRKIRNVHMRDLFLEEYPWRRLIGLLKGIGYSGYCCAEIPESCDPLRIMRYFRAMLLAYSA
ncbi:MAG: sugar phosphate isomerase/epimerase [Acidobacteria bacterium]|nr:sugar phosphate isomerase/epimerase [Acidobacteriota bacterium]